MRKQLTITFPAGTDLEVRDLPTVTAPEPTPLWQVFAEEDARAAEARDTLAYAKTIFRAHTPALLDYPEDVARIQQAAATMGLTLTALEAQDVWREYSAARSVGWIQPPKDAEDIREILRDLIEELACYPPAILAAAHDEARMADREEGR